MSNQVAAVSNVIAGELAAEVARRFGEVRLKVRGGSMLPAIWPGDIVTVRHRSFAEIRPGQIVMCYQNHGFVAHRFVGRQDGSLITRGDSLPYNDPAFRKDELLGEVVNISRNGRFIDCSLNRWYCAAAWILRHSELCTRILLRLRRQFSPPRAPQQES